jgi:hypothetical protein
VRARGHLDEAEERLARGASRGLLNDGRVNGAEERLDGRELLGVRRGGGIAAEEADVKVGLGELEHLAVLGASCGELARQRRRAGRGQCAEE